MSVEPEIIMSDEEGDVKEVFQPASNDDRSDTVFEMIQHALDRKMKKKMKMKKSTSVNVDNTLTITGFLTKMVQKHLYKQAQKNGSGLDGLSIENWKYFLHTKHFLLLLSNVENNMFLYLKTAPMRG